MKVCLIIPYFGKLPLTFNSWLKSAIVNDGIDFHLITDQTINYNLPSHIIVHKISFDSLQAKIYKTLDATIKSPYKLCDYKPTYGFLFQDILVKYDYWGYSDLDLVYGNLNEFIRNESVFGYYDKIFTKGHLSFYRNITIVNEIFRAKIGNLSYWQYIKNSKIIWVFDEQHSEGMIGINGIMEFYGFRIYPDKYCFADINPEFYGFFDVEKEKQLLNSFFCLHKGILKQIFFLNGEVEEKVVLYAHFQKRVILEIITAKGEHLFLPRHWTHCSSYNDAVAILRSENKKDRKKRSSQKIWLIKRMLRKRIIFMQELFLYREAFLYFIGFLRKKYNYCIRCIKESI